MEQERHPLEDQPLWNLTTAIERRGFTANNVFHVCHWLTKAAEANRELEQRVAELERLAAGAKKRAEALRSGLERIADLGLPPAEEVDGRAEAIAVTTLEADDEVRQPAGGPGLVSSWPADERVQVDGDELWIAQRKACLEPVEITKGWAVFADMGDSGAGFYGFFEDEDVARKFAAMKDPEDPESDLIFEAVVAPAVIAEPGIVASNHLDIDTPEKVAARVAELQGLTARPTPEEPADEVRQPEDGFDYEAAHAHADLATGDKVRGGIVQKGSRWMVLFGQHCYRQGLAARLTSEELRAIGDAVGHLLVALHGDGLRAKDEVSIRRALPVLQALAGKGAG